MAKKNTNKTRPVETTPTEVESTDVPVETTPVVEEKKVKKAKGKKEVSEVVAEPTPTPTEEVVEDKPVVSEKRSKKKVAVKKEEEVVEPTPTPVSEVVADEELVHEEVVEEEVVQDEKTGERRKRRLVTKDKLLTDIEALQKDLLPLLDNNKKVQKLFKTVISDTFRLLKIKTAQKKQKDATNSGFMRPVKPSPALQKFLSHLGENPNPLTRAHLTTLICKYIKEKDLQNPQDRRIIFPDNELKELFQIGEYDPEPLTYYNIQKRIQPHVSRIEDVLVETA